MDKTQSSRCFGGNNTAGEIDTATAVNAKGGGLGVWTLNLRRS